MATKSPEMCIMQPSPPQHQMHCSTDPLLGSSLPGDEGTAGGTCRSWAVLRWCNHTEGPWPAPSSPLPCTSPCLHTFLSPSPTPAPRGHLGKGMRNFLRSLLIQYKQSLVNSICPPRPWDRVALAEGTSGTRRQACPLHIGL